MLRELRKKNGLTQVELGEKIGVTGSAIVQYEKGKRVPDLFTVVRLSEVLNVSVEIIVRAFVDKNPTVIR